MIIKKTVKVPIHFETTKTKLNILDDTKLDRTTIRKLVKNSNISQITGLSYGFRDQCIDKLICAWKSYRKKHIQWEKKVKTSQERIVVIKKRSPLDEKALDKKEKTLKKLLKREPSRPTFQDKTPCRIDYRTGRVERSDSRLSPLWVHVSTLEKNKTIDIPLNPSQYHLNQLEDVEIGDFEIIKHNKKYYIHISITKEIENQAISSIGGIDQGLNKSIAAVLLTEPFPREEQLLDPAKVELLEKYDDIVSSLQEAEKWDKLRELRNKRENVSIYHDWCLAKQVARFTEGSYIAIGNTNFRQTQIRGNGNPTLRKRVGKWSYARQRTFIALKRAELGYPTELQNDRLQVQMSMEKTHASA